MSELREAAQAVVAHWDSPDWKRVVHTSALIDRLRAALAQPEAELAWRDAEIERLLRTAIERHVAEAVARERQRCANILASVSRSNPMSARDCLDIILAGAEKETK